MLNSTQQFSDAIKSAGLIPPDAIEADGAIHRFASNGKRGDDAGWYQLHSDGIPAGSFGCWRDGLTQTWRADVGRTLTPAEEVLEEAIEEQVANPVSVSTDEDDSVVDVTDDAAGDEFEELAKATEDSSSDDDSSDGSSEEVATEDDSKEKGDE